MQRIRFRCKAIVRDEFRLDYQPVVDVETQEIVGAEARVRWERPRRGVVPPVEFSPPAEETKPIRPLGTRVLKEACRQLARWSRAEGWPSDFVLSVNLSFLQLNEPTIVDDVASALAVSGVDPATVCLEITESALVDDMEGALVVLHRLRSLGLRLAIAGFGTGHSSFRDLHRLPVDVLKIDRSFVMRLGEGPRDQAVVAGMIDLSHALGLRVVAEGVETPGQLAALGGMTCDLAQGHYFAAPRAPRFILEAVLETGFLVVES